MSKDQEKSPIDSVKVAVGAASDKKARDILILDITGLSNITDFFMICSGGTDRQTKTIAAEIRKKLKETERRPYRAAGEDIGDWILLDYGDFVVHIFTEEMRDYYQLERLWKDAPTTNFK